MAPLIHSTVPVLPSMDLAASEAFYVQRPGFRATLSMPGTYLIVERDSCEIHFWPCGGNTERPRHSSCHYSRHVRGGTHAPHADFTVRGLPLGAPRECEWGMRELYVIDPHGNLLKFGEPL